MGDIPFNPLDKRNLGESVAGALLTKAVGLLPPANSFVGAGIYAIYYTGEFASYRRVKERNIKRKFEQPIYVGKAVPKGARKGGFGLGTAAGNALFSRLREHANSIKACTSLKLADFNCRFLVVEDIWIPLGEALLIEKFQPLWNILVDGFGNHATGERRAMQYRSRWDTLHPGRQWAAKLSANPETPEQITKIIADFYAGKAVPVISTEAAVIEEEED